MSDLNGHSELGFRTQADSRLGRVAEEATEENRISSGQAHFSI